MVHNTRHKDGFGASMLYLLANDDGHKRRIWSTFLAGINGGNNQYIDGAVFVDVPDTDK